MPESLMDKYEGRIPYEWSDNNSTSFERSAANWRGCLRRESSGVSENSLYELWMDGERCKYFIHGYMYHPLPQCACAAVKVVMELASQRGMVGDEITLALGYMGVNRYSQVAPEDVSCCQQHKSNLQAEADMALKPKSK